MIKRSKRKIIRGREGKLLKNPKIINYITQRYNSFKKDIQKLIKSGHKNIKIDILPYSAYEYRYYIKSDKGNQITGIAKEDILLKMKNHIENISFKKNSRIKDKTIYKGKHSDKMNIYIKNPKKHKYALQYVGDFLKAVIYFEVSDDKVPYFVRRIFKSRYERIPIYFSKENNAIYIESVIKHGIYDFNYGYLKEIYYLLKNKAYKHIFKIPIRFFIKNNRDFYFKGIEKIKYTDKQGFLN